jgi:hypothetical protein
MVPKVKNPQTSLFRMLPLHPISWAWVKDSPRDGQQFKNWKNVVFVQICLILAIRLEAYPHSAPINALENRFSKIRVLIRRY